LPCIDGGKRLEAAQALVKSGDLPADALIPVIDATGLPDAEARELSLTLNLIRADMHPVDAYRAFVALHTDKERPLDVDAIATRFGISAKTVKQRLALARVHDSILDAWLAQEIERDVVQAFTLCPDKDLQAKTFAKLRREAGPHRHINGQWVKSQLKLHDNPGRLLHLIGTDAYEARGGKVLADDLFGNDHIVSDGKLLMRLVEEKVDATCADLVAKEGWSFAIQRPQNSWDYGHIPVDTKLTPAEQKRIKKLENIVAKDAEEDELGDDAMAAQNELDKIRAEIEARAYTLEAKAKSGCFVWIDVHDGNTLKIERGRTKVKARQEIASSPSKKKAAVASKDKPKGPPVLTQALQQRLCTVRRVALSVALRTSPNQSPLSKLTGDIIASLIQPESRYSWAPDRIIKREKDLLEAVDGKTLNEALRKNFDADDYFKGCGKAFCIAAITEAVNADEARKVSGKKGGEIAKFAIANVGKTGWLPKELRTSKYDVPKPQRVSLAKEAAKRAAKKPAKKR
jgi:ParB family chromosome partitioning protein